jgi:adenosylcobinamide amidohydrolase
MTKIVKRELVGESHGIRAEIVTHNVWLLEANTLVLQLPEPRPALTAYQGYRRGSASCNFYHPQDLWYVMDNRRLTFGHYFRWIHREPLLAIVPGQQAAVLSTGVNMYRHAVAEESFEEVWVQVWATAGVKTNAIRVGRDTAFGIERGGNWQPFEEQDFPSPGTINIIVLTSAKLGQAALASAFITITEAKTAALLDLDVRSSYHPEWQATGTSTDQICVVSGDGDECWHVSGQVKLGELMARAVTKAVTEAINNSRTADV